MSVKPPEPDSSTRKLWRGLDLIEVMLLFPTLLFIVGFFHLWVGTLCILFAALFLCLKYRSLRTAIPADDTDSDRLLIFTVLSLAALSAILPGYIPIYPTTQDMPKQILLLKELIRNPWPVVHTDCYVPNMPCGVYMRYILSYYTLPALLTRLTGEHTTGIWITLIYTAFYAALFDSCAAYFLRFTRSTRLVALMLVAFLFFGDLDFLYDLMTRGTNAFGEHTEVIFRFSFEYFSPISLFRWVPQHGLIAFYAALFFLTAWDTRRYTVWQSLVSLFIIGAWSPFVALGFGVLMAVYHGMKSAEPRPQPKYLWEIAAMLACLLGLILLVFSSGNSQSIPRGFFLPPEYFSTAAADILPLAALCMLVLRGKDRIAAMLLIGFLCVLPFYSVGLYHDLARYTSAPILITLKLLVLSRLAAMKLQNATYAVVAVLAFCLMDGVNELCHRGNFVISPNLVAFDPADFLYKHQLNWEIAINQYFAPCPGPTLIAGCH